MQVDYQLSRPLPPGLPLCTVDTTCRANTTIIHNNPHANKEMHHHIYTSCPATADLRSRRDREVDEIIQKHTSRINTHISPWFSMVSDPATACSPANRALTNYN